MRGTLRLIASDIRYGLGHAVVGRMGILLATSVIILFLSYAVLRIFTSEFVDVSIGESLLCLWRGTRPYVAGSGLPFNMPLKWLALVMCCLYVGADYPTRDLSGFGSHIIVASGSRLSWWLSRCAWVVSCSLACFIISSLPAVLLTLTSGGTFDLAVRPEVVKSLGVGSSDILEGMTGEDYLLPLSQQPWISIALPLASIPALLASAMLVQTCLSLWTGPVVSMAICTSLLFITTLTGPWTALGFSGGPTPLAFLMAGRTGALMRGGTDPGMGLLVAGVIALAAVAIGAIAFCHKDIIGRKENAS